MTPLRIALIAALAVAAAAPAGSKPAMPTVNITLASHYYHPNPIYLAGGVPVRLIFTNRSGKSHDFKAPAFFRSARIMRGSAPGGEIELKKGRGTVMVLVPARGTYKVHCTEPFHTMLGMTGRIIVN
jgi:uncharacterized cupredoxin-like copper-binding protein